MKKRFSIDLPNSTLALLEEWIRQAENETGLAFSKNAAVGYIVRRWLIGQQVPDAGQIGPSWDQLKKA